MDQPKNTTRRSQSPDPTNTAGPALLKADGVTAAADVRVPASRVGAAASRAKRYAEAMGTPMPLPLGRKIRRLEAVLAVADEEQAELKAEAERVWGDFKALAEQVADTRRRAEAAERARDDALARESRLRGAVEGLLVSWTEGIEVDLTMGSTKAEVEPLERLICHLRALLVEQEPPAATEDAPTEQGEGGA